MIELGQLERRHEDFDQRHTRVIVVSVEKLDQAQKTQADFPHLLVLSDAEHGLSDAAALIHSHAAPDGSDVDAPTTILVDRHGTVRWLYRSPEVLARLAPDEVVQAIDQHMAGTP
ncbi:MAG: redoxin domain-containing protein [Planctomycetes bacterium]|nr:redoxin domain-containing protein [Planctomycetota bacterium]